MLNDISNRLLVYADSLTSSYTTTNPLTTAFHSKEDFMMTQEQLEKALGKKLKLVLEALAGEEDFQAYNSVEATLKKAGFSVGSMQREAPIGIVFGDADISKWRNLGEDVKQLDGVIVCSPSPRNGSVAVYVTHETAGKL
jgi:hypothetical protein